MKEEPWVPDNCLFSIGFVALMCSASLIEMSKSFFPLVMIEKLSIENLDLHNVHDDK